MYPKTAVCSLLVLVLAGHLLLSACGAGSEEKTPDGDVDGEFGSDGETEEEERFNTDGSDGDVDLNGDMNADDLVEGLWAIRFSMASTCLLPIFERRVQIILSGIGLLEVTQDGAALELMEKSCDSTLKVVEEEEIPFIAVFPQIEIAAIPTATRQGELRPQDDPFGFSVYPSLDIYGADAGLFSDPQNDPLPSDSDDPRVVNLGDENPGITVRLMGPFSGMEVYIVMRMERELVGSFETADLISGDVFAETEVKTIGASDPWMALQLDFEPHPIPELNRFEIRRLEAGTTCEWINENQDELFTYNAADHAVPFTYDR